MKEKIISLVLVILFMALLPICAVRCNSSSSSKSAVASADTAKANRSDPDEIICAQIAAIFNKEWSFEALRAYAVVFYTNYIFNKDNIDTSDKRKYIFEDEASSTLQDDYPQIRKAVKSVQKLTISFNDKVLQIPFSICSNGQTHKSQKYKYLCSVASPWDSFLKSESKDENCIGLSLDGINYLCSNGYSYKQSLLWYLPNAEISAYNSK